MCGLCVCTTVFSMILPSSMLMTHRLPLHKYGKFFIHSLQSLYRRIIMRSLLMLLQSMYKRSWLRFVVEHFIFCYIPSIFSVFVTFLLCISRIMIWSKSDSLFQSTWLMSWYYFLLRPRFFHSEIKNQGHENIIIDLKGLISLVETWSYCLFVLRYSKDTNHWLKRSMAVSMKCWNEW